MTALAFSGEARHHTVPGIALTVAGRGPLIDNRRAWAARGAVPLSAAHPGARTLAATHEWHRHTPTRTGGVPSCRQATGVAIGEGRGVPGAAAAYGPARRLGHRRRARVHGAFTAYR